MILHDFCMLSDGIESFIKLKTTQNSSMGGWAECKSVLTWKAELPLNGGLAFLFGKSVLIAFNYLKIYKNFDIGKLYMTFRQDSIHA